MQTVFLYLSDCVMGGRTRFRWLDGLDSIPGAGIFSQCIESSAGSSGICDQKRPADAELSITPRAGMAVLHFPTTTHQSGGCIPDPRTLHESEPAGDTKLIVQQFIWPVPIDPASDVHEDVRREWSNILASARPAGVDPLEQCRSASYS